jgi:hypothetical protein
MSSDEDEGSLAAPPHVRRENAIERVARTWSIIKQLPPHQEMRLHTLLRLIFSEAADHLTEQDLVLAGFKFLYQAKRPTSRRRVKSAAKVGPS